MTILFVIQHGTYAARAQRFPYPEHTSEEEIERDFVKWADKDVKLGYWKEIGENDLTPILG